MIKRWIDIFLACSFVCGVSCTGLAQSGVANSYPTDDSEFAGLYTLLARVGAHPSVEVERANFDAARHRIPINSSLPNPMLMLGAINLPTSSWSFSEDPMTAKMIGVSQSIPFPGKLRAERTIAANDTVTEGAKLTEKENELARDIKQAFFEEYHLARAIEVNQDHVKAVNQLLTIAQQNLASGAGSQANILDLQLERADMQSEVIEEQTEFAKEHAMLERASGETLLAMPMPESLGLPEFSYTISELDTMAVHNRPLLAAIRSESGQEELKYRRAELDKYPDFNFSLDYMQRDPLSATSAMNPTNSVSSRRLGITPMAMTQPDMISAEVSIDLPLFYGNQRQESLGEAEAMRTMRSEEEAAGALDIHTELETALAKLDGIRKEYDLLRIEIYPAVKMSLATSNANYIYGKAGIDAVLRDELALMHREHDRYRLEAEYNETLATIEYLTGTNLVHYSTKNDWK